MKFVKLLFMIILFHSATYGQDSLNCRLLTKIDNLVNNVYALEIKDDFAFTGFDNYL